MVEKATMDPWHVDEANFPSQASLQDQLQFLLTYAVLAPSSHNTQPWLFRVDDAGVELYADRTRALPVVDPEDRALIISCGAALFNLRVAMRHFGFTDVVQLFPYGSQHDLLARVSIGLPRPTTADDNQRFSAIPLRRSNRQPFESRQVAQTLIDRLDAAASEESTWMAVVTGDETRNAVADLIAEGDRMQAASKPFCRELSAWMHHNWSRSRDGMRGYAHGMGELASLVGPFLIRTFDWGNGQAAKDRQLAVGSPVLAVLGTASDDPAAWLAAGQALSNILLLACAEGVHNSYLNQPIEVPELRPRLRDLIGRGGFPQILVRLGYGPDTRPTPRREVSEVVVS
jgi:hypothetical protein